MRWYLSWFLIFAFKKVMHYFWNLTAWSNVQKDQKIPSSRNFHPPGTHCQQRTWKWQKCSLRVPWVSRRVDNLLRFALKLKDFPPRKLTTGTWKWWGFQYWMNLVQGGPHFQVPAVSFRGCVFYRWWFTKSNCTRWSWCVCYTLSGGNPWKKWTIHDACMDICFS